MKRFSMENDPKTWSSLQDSITRTLEFLGCGTSQYAMEKSKIYLVYIRNKDDLFSYLFYFCAERDIVYDKLQEIAYTSHSTGYEKDIFYKSLF